MRYVGIDLHKRSMTVCVFGKDSGETFARRFRCSEEARISAFFAALGPFEAVVEATATYQWLWELLEPLAARLVLAHPKKLRIIAESMKKSDKHDAYFLAWLLSLDAVPQAHRPTPRQREHQQLVKHRLSCVRQRSRLRVQIRSILAARNLDFEALFSPKGLAKLEGIIPRLSSAERFCIRELLAAFEAADDSVERATRALAKFRRSAPEAEKARHSIVTSVPGVGDLVADVVLSTLGDIHRFPNAQKCTAYAGLVPGFRESDAKRRELGITKEGPRQLRWALVESAWRAVRYSRYWREEFESIAARRGRKKAVVAVARRLLAVIYALLKRGEPYQEKPRKGRPKNPSKMKLSA